MSIFKFKYFDILQADNAMKVGTDAMLLGSFIDVTNKKSAVDVGAGTGVLSLMMAQKNPIVNVLAIELDQLSANECATNFTKSNWKDRLKVNHGDFLTFETIDKFDLIISNPPFYQTRLLNDDSRKAVARHENSLPMNQLLKKAMNLLEEEGDIWLIVPAIDAQKWEVEGKNIGLFPKKRINIHGKVGVEVKRSIVNFSKQKNKYETIDFYVRSEDNSYTSDYISLTKEFHHTML